MDSEPARRSGHANVALVTGASMGLGRALAAELAARGWRLIIDARDGHRLAAAQDLIARRASVPGAVTAISGDVADAGHRQALAEAAIRAGRLDLLVNNASELGTLPPRPFRDLPFAALQAVFAVNVFAAVELTRAVLPLLRAVSGCVLTISSDAAVTAYPGWGGYGASKAALDHVAAVLAIEEPQLHVYAVDPGDMATDLKRAASPEEDVDALPDPGQVAPRLLPLVYGQLPSGRYLAAEIGARPPVSGSSADRNHW